LNLKGKHMPIPHEFENLSISNTTKSRSTPIQTKII
jgi:hypothetical protein